MATAPQRSPQGPLQDSETSDIRPRHTAPGEAHPGESTGESAQDVVATRGGDPGGHTPTERELTLRDEAGSSQSKPSPRAHQHPTLQQIASEAYAIYKVNGGRHGRDMDDWLEAERRLRSERG